MGLYLEAVTVCVNYSDFLAHTLPHNKQMFNKYVVVTDTKDLKTKAICDHYKVQCIQTDVFYENGNVLNKGKGINVGLAALSKKGFVVHLDSDVYLPPLTRDILEKIPFDPKGIYGVDRMMCPTYQEWQKYVSDPKPIHDSWVYVHPSAFPMGVRIAQYYEQGYLPIGYFQMWNPSGSGVYEYPKEHGEVDRSDVIFAKKFSRDNRHLIPEIIAIHLDSEDLDLKQMGKNWQGRKTKPFKPDVDKHHDVDHHKDQHDRDERRKHEHHRHHRGYKHPWWHKIKRIFSTFAAWFYIILAIELLCLFLIFKTL
jgi:hypothetical protein